MFNCRVDLTSANTYNSVQPILRANLAFHNLEVIDVGPEVTKPEVPGVWRSVYTTWTVSRCDALSNTEQVLLATALRCKQCFSSSAMSRRWKPWNHGVFSVTRPITGP